MGLALMGALRENSDDAAVGVDVAPPSKPNYLVHSALFVATCVTTYYFGGGGRTWFSRDAYVFAGTLMGILFTHEMGHFIVARRHGIDASPPYFVPIPLALGTLGAVIKMQSPIRRRDALIDVGAAGPLAGLIVAMPLLVIGLMNSPVVEIVTKPGQIAMVEGNSLLYFLLKLAVFGRALPSADGFDVQLGPMAMAAWWGFFLTFINLLPIGQLDGGHVAHAYFGNDHEKRAPWLHRALVLVGALVFVVLTLEASDAGREINAAARYGAQMNNESGYPNNRGIGWLCGYYLTYSETALSAWDASGTRVATTTLSGGGVDYDGHFSYGTTMGRFWVVEGNNGNWLGYDVGL